MRVKWMGWALLLLATPVYAPSPAAVSARLGRILARFKNELRHPTASVRAAALQRMADDYELALRSLVNEAIKKDALPPEAKAILSTRTLKSTADGTALVSDVKGQSDGKVIEAIAREMGQNLDTADKEARALLTNAGNEAAGTRLTANSLANRIEKHREALRIKSLKNRCDGPTGKLGRHDKPK